MGATTLPAQRVHHALTATLADVLARHSGVAPAACGAVPL